MVQCIEKPRSTRTTPTNERRSRPPVASSATTLTQPPNVISLLQALQRCWKLAVPCATVLAVLAAGAALVLVPSSKYTARSTLFVNSQPTSFMFRTQEQAQAQFTNYKQTQIALIKGRTVLQTALDRPEVKALALIQQNPNPLEWLEKELLVDSPSSEAETVRIGLSGNQSEELVVLVKAITNAYLEQVVGKEQAERIAQRDQLQIIFDGYEAGLAERRKKIEEVARGAGADERQTLILKQKLAQDSLSSAQNELLRVQGEVRTYDIDLQAMKAKEKVLAQVKVPDYLIDEAMRKDKDPLLEGYTLELARLNAEITEIRKRFKPGYEGPYIREQQAQVKSLQDAINGQREKARPALEIRERDRMNHEFKANLAQLEDKVNNLRRLEKTLQDRVDSLVKDAKLITESTFSLNTQQAAIAKEETIQKTVGEELEKRNVELMAKARVTLLEQAALSHSIDARKPIKAAGMAGCGMFGLVLFGFAWREFLGRRIHTADEISDNLGLRVLGTLPEVRGPHDTVGQNLLAESADATRAMVLQAIREEGLKSLLITSAVSGEGKTTLATQLAASLGRAGLRTLLIDGDLRNPSAHTAFALSVEPGLSEVLRGEVHLESVLRPTSMEEVYLLSAGCCDPRTLQALAGEQLGEIFAEVKEQFDFVLVDSSPVLPVADALSFGRHVEAAVVAVMRNVSQLRQVHAALERLAGLGLRVLGASLHAVRDELFAPAYRYVKTAR